MVLHCIHPLLLLVLFLPICSHSLSCLSIERQIYQSNFCGGLLRECLNVSGNVEMEMSLVLKT